MSDRVTNTDIEDVLSSIRRLVSVDHRSDESDVPEKEPDTPSFLLGPTAKVDPAPPVSERESPLVLSSTLRVGEPEHADPDVRAEHETPANTELPKDDRLELARWQIEPDAMVPDSPDEDGDAEHGAAQDTSFEDDLDESAASPSVVTRDESTGPESETQFRSVREQDKEPLDDTPESVTSGVNELEARVAEVEAAVAARDDQWEPDGSEPGAGAPPPIAALPWLTQQDSAREDVAAPKAREATAKKVSETAPQAPVTQDQSAPDWYGDDTILDEAALRDLVSEIVRQELQGSLGERITRNVRKLVRREIHRAMMGHELD